MTSVSTSNALKTSSLSTTTTKGYNFDRAVGNSTGKQHTTTTTSITVAFGNATQHVEKASGIKASLLVAVITSSLILLLLLVAFLIFMVWRKRYSSCTVCGNVIFNYTRTLMSKYDSGQNLGRNA